MEGEGEGSYAWKPMEGKVEGFYARRPMEGKGKGSYVRRSMEGKGKGSFSPLPTFPPSNFTYTFFFSFHIKVLLYHGSRPLFTSFLPFLWPINYDRAF
jgi:hypothetical protein